MLIKPDGTAVQERTSFETAVSMNPYSKLSADCQIMLSTSFSQNPFVVLFSWPITLFLPQKKNPACYSKVFFVNIGGSIFSKFLRGAG